MKKYENNPKEFLHSLSDEEFRQLLEKAGFEVEDGNGEIVYTETQTHKDFQYDLNGSMYSLNQKNEFKSDKNKDIKFEFNFLVA